jgi:SAM-dependent methyltransferase
VGGFSAQWLSMREPADHLARSASLARAAIERSSRESRVRILDLAAGTGSNLRYIEKVALRSDASAEFLLVDHDPALLAQVPKAPAVATRCLDLATLNDRTLFAGRSLVTASALLDLVSERWLRSLADRCAAYGAAVLFALTYDGRIVCTPEDRDDGTIVARVNEHQRRDKGFGPALGPDATNCADRCFRERGYQVARDRSDWQLTPAHDELQRQLIDGWAQAAIELHSSDAAIVEAWRRRRHAHVDANRSGIVVGHEDLLGTIETENW